MKLHATPDFKACCQQLPFPLLTDVVRCNEQSQLPAALVNAYVVPCCIEPIRSGQKTGFGIFRDAANARQQVFLTGDGWFPLIS